MKLSMLVGLVFVGVLVMTGVTAQEMLDEGVVEMPSEIEQEELKQLPIEVAEEEIIVVEEDNEEEVIEVREVVKEVKDEELDDTDRLRNALLSLLAEEEREEIENRLDKWERKNPLELILQRVKEMQLA